MTGYETERFAVNHRPMAAHGARRLPISELVNGNGHGHEPEVYRCTENGRVYYAYRGAIVYPFPCDEKEEARMDQFHHLIHALALKGSLFIADLSTRANRPQILDVGFGTGVWAVEMATTYPGTDVFGIDLIDNQPKSFRNPVQNVHFRTGVDFTSPNWGFRESNFDLIRMAQLCGCVADWSKQYSNVYRHLKPGTGYIEHIEVDWTPRCLNREGFPPDLEPVQHWWELMKDASRRLQRPIAYCEDTEDLLTNAGFTDISHRTIRICLQARRREERELTMKRWFQSIVCLRDENDGGDPEAFESLSMSLLTRQLNMSIEKVRELCSVLQSIYVSDPPLYHNLHIWTARKPMN